MGAFFALILAIIVYILLVHSDEMAHNKENKEESEE